MLPPSARTASASRCWKRQNEHVGTALIQRMENRLPGLYYIETDSTGERTFYYWRNEAAAKFWLESDAAPAICEALASFDYLYLSGISPAILSPVSREKLLSLLHKCRANGGKVILITTTVHACGPAVKRRSRFISRCCSARTSRS